MTFKEYLRLVESNPEKRSMRYGYSKLYPPSYGVSYRSVSEIEGKSSGKGKGTSNSG